MADPRHSYQSPTNGNVHVFIAWTYADAVNRAAHIPATGPTAPLSSVDVGKACLQTDDGSFWALSNYAPITWVNLGGTSPHADSHLSGSDVIPNATITTSGLMSPEDKVLLGNIVSGSVTGVSKAVLVWGNGSIAAGAGLRYLVPGYNPSAAETAPVQIRAPSAGTLKNMMINQSPAGNGSNITFNVRVASSQTALQSTIQSTTAQGSNLSSSVSVAQGALIDLEVDKQASIGVSTSNVTVTCEFEAS